MDRIAIAGEGGNPTLNSPVSTYAGQYLQEMYNWVNSSVFYNYAPPYLLPFYKKVQNWDRWINGYVPTFHSFEQGVLPTHLSKFIVDKVSSLIYGNGVVLSNAGNKSDKTAPNDTLEKIGEWASDVHLADQIKTCIRYAVGLGTGVMKLNIDADYNPWVESVPMNRCRYDYDAKGNPSSASFQLATFFQNRRNSDFGFGLFEKRFYMDCKPYGVYAVYKLNTRANQAQSVDTADHIEFKSLPEWCKRTIKESYGTVRLDEPMRLPFGDLGIYPYRFTNTVSSMPHLKYGDSVLEGLNDYLCKYDQLAAAMDTELYCGRARAYVKKNIKNPTMRGSNYNEGIDSFMFTEYEEMGTESKPIQFFQPEIRTEQLRGIRNIILEDICTAIGIAPSSFASFLQDGAQRTAREISAEENATTLFVANHRQGLLDAVNRMLETVAGYYGMVDRVNVQFSQAGQTNYTLLVENTTKLYQTGLMSLESAVKAVNPSMDEAQLAEEIEKLKAQEKEKMSAQRENLWDFGDREAFGG